MEKISKASYEKYLDEDLALGAGCCYTNRTDGCTTGMEPFGYNDYFDQRPGQRIPRSHEHILQECQRIYDEHGTVRNIVDVMVDFTVSNIMISHPVPKYQRIVRNWFKKVEGVDTSSKFALNMYLFGAAIVDPYKSKLTKKQKDELAKASIDNFKRPKKTNKIVTTYKFLNPGKLIPFGGSLLQFKGGDAEYMIKLPYDICQLLTRERSQPDKLSEEDKKLLSEIPEEIRSLIQESDGFNYYKINRDLRVFHYRKHDWQVWAKPIVYSVYNDITMLEQSRLADRAALDSAIGQTTIFKLGSLEHQTMPTKAAFQKLKGALSANTNGGRRVLVWGPDIEIEETSVEIHKILDPKKYDPIMQRIYGGLGVPPTMTGSNQGGSGTTNNLVSLNGFIERLEYGRDKLKCFWSRELRDLQVELGVAKPFVIEFDIPNLGDIEAEKKLIIELGDRGIVSDEFICNKFKIDPSLENKRINRENSQRDGGKRSFKAGPFNDPEMIKKCIKSLVENGRLPIDELGIKSKTDNKVLTQEDEITTVEPNQDDDTFKQNRKSMNGRPPGSKDAVKRKRNKNKTIVRANKIWAKSIQKDIDQVVNPIILSQFNKKNMRSLNSEEKSVAEYVKLGTLFNLKSGKTNEEDIIIASSSQFKINLINEYNSTIKEIPNLTVEQKKDIAADIFAESA